MDADLLIPLITVFLLFVACPAVILHYMTLWRKQKTLLPDDERMLEDLWRSARSIERRIETIEELLDAQEEDETSRSRRPFRSSRYED